LEAAATAYEEALAARGDFPEALANSASVALDRGRLEEARGRYARALALVPGFADAEYGLGQIALREGRLAEGWDGYERRFDTHPPPAIRRELPLPRLTEGA